MKKKLFIVVMIFSLFISCKNRDTIPWDISEVSDLHIRLIDDRSYASYYFNANGDVSATIGKVEGPFTGPILFWKIDSTGKLLIYEEIVNDTWAVLEKIDITETNLEVLENGRRKQYLIIDN